MPLLPLNMATRLSPEIIIQILKNFEIVEEVVVYASACRKFHEVWLCHAPQIIWTIGQRQILAFDDALMAVSGGKLYMLSTMTNEFPGSSDRNRARKLPERRITPRPVPPFHLEWWRSQAVAQRVPAGAPL
jgi:hypothetical protein